MANDYSFQGRARNIALQERAVEEAQRKLNRIEKMREEMARQVQLEMKRLEEMRKQASDFTRANADSLTTPSLSASAPESFQSQFDKFNTTPAAKLEQPGKNGVAIDIPSSPTGQQADNLKAGNKTGIDLGPLETANGEPLQNQSFYRNSDRDQHWNEINTDPGVPVYVSGYYESSGPASKRYEYRVSSGLVPLKVGDRVDAVVHPGGHNRGFISNKPHDRRFIITDIYTTQKYSGDHDIIWKHHAENTIGMNLEGSI